MIVADNTRASIGYPLNTDALRVFLDAPCCPPLPAVVLATKKPKYGVTVVISLPCIKENIEPNTANPLYDFRAWRKRVVTNTVTNATLTVGYAPYERRRGYSSEEIITTEVIDGNWRTSTDGSTVHYWYSYDNPNDGPYTGQLDMVVRNNEWVVTHADPPDIFFDWFYAVPTTTTEYSDEITYPMFLADALDRLIRGQEGALSAIEWGLLTKNDAHRHDGIKTDTPLSNGSDIINPPYRSEESAYYIWSVKTSLRATITSLPIESYWPSRYGPSTWSGYTYPLHGWKSSFGSGIRFAARVGIRRSDALRPDNDPIHYTEEMTDLETPTIPVEEGATEVTYDITDLLPAAWPGKRGQQTGIFLTGPKRKLRPSIHVDTVVGHHLPAQIYQALDGSREWFKTPDRSTSISPNEALTAARDAARDAVNDQVFNNDPLISFDLNGHIRSAANGQGFTTVLACTVVSPSRCRAVVTQSRYKIVLTRPSLPADRSGTVEAKWIIHTLNTATGNIAEEAQSASYTWEAQESGHPTDPEDEQKELGPYEVTAAEGEVKWIEVLEPEEAQHVWPAPIWYIAPEE